MKRLNITSLISALVCVSALTLTVAVSVAQERTGDGKSAEGLCGAGCYLGCYEDGIDLSDAQKAQMRERVERHREATAGLRDQLRTLRQQSSATDVATNEASVRAAAQTRANMQVELEVAHARLTSELNNLLTPEQKAKRAELQRQRQDRLRNRRSRRELNRQY